MKKVICIKNITRLNCKVGDMFDLVEEVDYSYWTIRIGNSVHGISKFFNEFMLLTDYRKLKLKKLNEIC